MQRSISIVTLGWMLMWPIMASAEEPSLAARLYEEAVQEMEVGNYDVGCPKMEESLRLGRNPKTIYALARCEADRKRPATALARYDEFLWTYEHLPEPDKAKLERQAQYALEQREQLSREAARLTMRLPANAPKHVQITRNAEPMDAASMGKEIVVDPGDHVMTTQVPGGMVRIVRIRLLRSERKEIQLEVDPPLIVRQDKSESHWKRTMAAVSFGVGGTLLVVGGVTGGLLLQSASVAESNCHKDGVCTYTGVEAVHDVQSKTPIVLGSLIGSAVSLGMGTIFLLSAPNLNAPKRGHLMTQWNMGIVFASPNSTLLGIHATW